MGWRRGSGREGEGDVERSVKTSSNKLNMFSESIVHHSDYSTYYSIIELKIAKRLDLKCSSPPRPNTHTVIRQCDAGIS